MTGNETTMYDDMASTPQGSAELAAARAASRVARLMSSAHKRSGLSQSTLADALRVTKGRVSQLLNGDGNVKISSVAKVLDALGYELTLDARPKSDVVPELTRRALQRADGSGAREDCVWAWRQHFASGEGITCVVLLMDEIDGEHTALDRPTLISTDPLTRTAATARAHSQMTTPWNVLRQGLYTDEPHAASV